MDYISTDFDADSSSHFWFITLTDGGIDTGTHTEKSEETNEYLGPPAAWGNQWFGLLLGCVLSVDCAGCFGMLLQKHGGNDDVLDTARCPLSRQPPSPASSSPGGAAAGAGGRNVGGKTTWVVPAATSNVVGNASNKLKVGCLYVHCC